MSSSYEWVPVLLMSLARLLPMLIVWFAGLVIALVRWPRCPAVSLLVVAAVLIAGLAGIGSQVFFMVVPRFWQGTDLARVATVVGLASTVVHAGAWACMLAAAFIGRGGPASPGSDTGAAESPIDKPR